MTSPMHIALLADHLHLVPVVSEWLYQEWDYLYPGGSLETRIQQVYGRAQPTGIPTVFIMLDGETPVGTSCLLEYDSAVDRAIAAAHTAAGGDPAWLEQRVIPSPWLASVYVVAEQRRRGIARRLVRHTMQAARDLGYPKLYLYTESEAAEALYHSLGWQVLERLLYPTMQTTLMVVDLSLSERSVR